MLQITEYNISLKLGLQKKARAFGYDWKGMRVRKEVETDICPSFWNLGLRTKNN